MNKKNYSEFYHLHIPKTGGTQLSSILNDNLFPILLKNNISIFNYNNYNKRNKSHSGWKPVIHNQYIVSSFRDPVKRIISHFFWMLKLIEKNEIKITKENKHLFYFQPNVKDYKNPTKQEFIYWIEKNKDYLSDYQSKNFFYRENDYVVPTCLQGSSSALSIKEFNKNEAIKNILRTDLLIKTENIKIDNFKNILNKILNDFDLKNENKIMKININLSNSYNKSLIFYKSLSKEEVEYIESLNILDLEIYNTDSFFWDPKS